MSLEFIVRANAIALELEAKGLTGTAAAMRLVVADYERSVKESQYDSPTAHEFHLVSRR